VDILKPEFHHWDSRRTLTQVFTARTEQVNFYQAKRGAVLGDHFHKRTSEYFLVTRGLIRYNGDQYLGKGMAFVVHPGENHTIECITGVSLVSFLTEPYDPKDPDICKKKPS
jgi:quercetin dioxygenase-like cupin family protein